MPAPAPTALKAPDTAPGWLQGLVLMLLIAGSCVPTEGAAQGETLWLAVLWLGAGSAAACWTIRGGRPAWLLADTGVLLLTGGQILSGLLTLWSGPDRHTAGMLLVEWAGLWAAWLALRVAFAKRGLPPQVLWLGTLFAVVLAGYGGWQHTYWYPSMAAEYGPRMELVRTIGAESPAARQAVEELRQAGIPTEGSALILFEKRLQDSREPFGPFALANTFGGFLAVWTTVACGLWWLRPGRDWRQQVTLALSAGVIVYCLQLTNSRTAWGGLTFALMTLGACVLVRRTGSQWPTRVCVFAAGLASIGIVVFGICSSGEQSTLPGPLKSLAYRFQYWQGTWNFLQADWLTGAGLGQFRTTYIAHKLPVASEDIADPHNLWLEVWANGGLLPLAGLGIVLMATMGPLWHRTEPDTAKSSVDAHTRWWSGGMAAGLLLVFVQAFAMHGEWHDLPLLLLLTWGSLAGGLAWSGLGAIGSSTTAVRQLCAAAAIGLMIHLTGAGGIGTPAVVQLLWLLVIGTLQPRSRELRATAWHSWPSYALTAAAAIAGLLALVGVVRPHQAAVSALKAGDDQIGRQLPDAALKNYQAAANADPTWVEPWLRMAGLHEREWNADRDRNARRFDEAAAALDAAWARHRGNHLLAQAAGKLWSERAAATQASNDRKTAIDWCERAVRAAPTSALLRAELALALAADQQQTAAAAAAEAALRQQAINESQGHIDRYLPPFLLNQVRQLASPGAPAALP